MMAFALPVPQKFVPVVTLTAGALDGVGIGVFEIIWVTVLQEMIPWEKLGRVTSVDLAGSEFLSAAWSRRHRVPDRRCGDTVDFSCLWRAQSALDLIGVLRARHPRLAVVNSVLPDPRDDALRIRHVDLIVAAERAGEQGLAAASQSCAPRW